MKLSKAKDILLNSLVNNTPNNIASEDKNTYYAALESLAEDKYITIIPTSISGSGRIANIRSATSFSQRCKVL